MNLQKYFGDVFAPLTCTRRVAACVLSVRSEFSCTVRGARKSCRLNRIRLAPGQSSHSPIKTLGGSRFIQPMIPEEIFFSNGALGLAQGKCHDVTAVCRLLI